MLVGWAASILDLPLWSLLLPPVRTAAICRALVVCLACSVLTASCGAIVAPPFQAGITQSAECQAVREDFPGSGLDVWEAGACALGNCGRRSVRGVVTEWTCDFQPSRKSQLHRDLLKIKSCPPTAQDLGAGEPVRIENHWNKVFMGAGEGNRCLNLNFKWTWQVL